MAKLSWVVLQAQIVWILNLLYMYSKWENRAMLAIRIDEETEKRLERLAKKTGRTKTFYAREAILQHLEDLEDYYLAAEAAKKPGKTFTGEEVRSELGL